jgi:hypothetical protein
MVLGREDHHAEASAPRGARPLPGIERRGREDARIFFSVAPLAVRERVDAEVKEEGKLVSLPLELGGGRNGAHGQRQKAFAA